MKQAIVIVLGLAAAQCALAQPEGAPPLPRPQHPDMLFLAGAELERERVVAGAPYCADAVHETVQALADGNRIVHRQQTRTCRDGQGRTRQEVASGPRRHVYLRDPVAQEAWLLDPEGKRATRLDTMQRGLPLGAPGAAAPSPGWDERMREWSREMREWGKSLRDKLRLGEAPPPAPQPPEGAPDGPPQHVRIFIGGPNSGELPPLPPPGLHPPPHPIAFHARLGAPRGPGVVTALPPETLEGLRAEGKRTTWTLEAGKIGNEKPIVITREVWTSPELQLTLRSRDANPLHGEDTYRLQNLARGEPDAQLFQVPADYRKVTPGARGKP